MLSEVQKAVVQIKTPQGTGSGFIIDKSGLVLTNAHVVGKYYRVNVLVKGLGVVERLGVSGDVIGVNEDSDLALVSVTSESEWPVLELGDSDILALGEEVVAVGYPLSPLLGEDIVVTRGIVSSRRRKDGIELIQTDAALNPGGSGGPLVNRQGQVIGVNTIRVDRTRERTVDRVGLAIAISHVKEQLPSLMVGGPVAGPYSGTFYDVTNDLKAEMTLDVRPVGDTLSGTVEVSGPIDRRGSIRGSVDGHSVSFTLLYSASGQSRTLTFFGTRKSRGSLTGVYEVSPTGEKGRWEVSRADAP